MIHLLLSLSLAATPSVTGRSIARPPVRGQVPPLPSFSFAGPGGQGMGLACACANPTGAKGEAMTVTRASTAYCSKAGLDTTGIQNGDLVSCGNNIARVMPTTRNGPLGVLVENAATNDTEYSEDLLTYWTSSGLAVAAPVRTADQATSPQGTLVADKIDFAAANTSQASYLGHAVACPGTSPATLSVYLKAVSAADATDSLDISIYDGTNYKCKQCTLTNTSWARCSLDNVAITGGAQQIFIGNFGNYCQAPNSVAHTAKSVYITNVQCEAGAYPTSYIATGAAPATRSADVVSLTKNVSIAPASMSFRSIAPWTSFPTGTKVWLAGRTGGGGVVSEIYNSDATGICLNTPNTNYDIVALSGSRLDWWCAINPSNPAAGVVVGRANNTNLTDSVAGAGSAGAVTAIDIGNDVGLYQPNSVIHSVCVDPNPLRCR